MVATLEEKSAQLMGTVAPLLGQAAGSDGPASQEVEQLAQAQAAVLQ